MLGVPAHCVRAMPSQFREFQMFYRCTGVSSVPFTARLDWQTS
jgi:hypothetical protein